MILVGDQKNHDLWEMIKHTQAKGIKPTTLWKCFFQMSMQQKN